MDSAVNKAREVIAQYGIQHPTAESFDMIFKGEDIRFKEQLLDEEKTLSGMLVYKGDKKGIIVNTFINNKGRHNFTKAHELGHYFLKHTPKQLESGTGFQCSNDDMDTLYKPIEVESNRFAVEFLMPETIFKLSILGAPFDHQLVANMAQEFKVSKHASSFRILDFVKSPCAVILTNGTTITSCKQSKITQGIILKNKTIPKNTLTYKYIQAQKFQAGFEPCDISLWCNKPKISVKLYSCTRMHKESGTAMTILRW